jgi:hypothetical protein
VDGSYSKKPLQDGLACKRYLSFGSPFTEVVVVVVVPHREDKESNNCSVLLENHSRVLEELMVHWLRERFLIGIESSKERGRWFRLIANIYSVIAREDDDEDEDEDAGAYTMRILVCEPRLGSVV